MLRLLLGKEGKNKVIDSIVDKAPNLLAEKVSSSILVKPSDDEKLRIEKQRLEIEKEKLEIEKKKLEIENDKLKLESTTKVNNNLDVAEINARSRKHGAYWRSGTTVATAAIVGFFTYNYVKPSEKELEKSKVERDKMNEDMIRFKKLFISAQADVDKEKKINKEMEKHLPQSVLSEINFFKHQKEQERLEFLRNYEASEKISEVINGSTPKNS